MLHIAPHARRDATGILYNYSYTYCFNARYLVSPSAQDAMGLGLYTILLLPILYAVYHTNGRSVRESCTAQ